MREDRGEVDGGRSLGVREEKFILAFERLLWVELLWYVAFVEG